MSNSVSPPIRKIGRKEVKKWSKVVKIHGCGEIYMLPQGCQKAVKRMSQSSQEDVK